jgi:hypothetical protein
VVAEEQAAEDGADQLSERDTRRQQPEVLIVPVEVRFPGDDLLHAEREREVPETEHRARCAESERRSRRGEEQAAGHLQPAPDGEQRPAAAVGEAAQRDRRKQRYERERRGDQADVARSRSERQQPVGRDGPRDVDGRLRDGQRGERVCEPPGQLSAATTVQASGGMWTLIRSPDTRCRLWTVSGNAPTFNSYS